MIKIPLHGKRGLGKFALIDDEDWDLVKDYKWYVGNGGYAKMFVRIDGVMVNQFMHKLIRPQWVVVDHFDHNKLNNTKQNLLKSSISLNNFNKLRRSGGSSNQKGVRLHKRSQKWDARINRFGIRYHLGYYKSESDAAEAYFIAARFLYPEVPLKTGSLCLR
jgi:hypothetical protein